ncbi:MAG: fimbria/pilus outer membrane usher protein, partial [Candidatus Eremiobacteraeota bacterium]|nr:fimbria/pilus outer membrane usher protein [Candidatus Eremiobacteraeota bacterium]
LSAAGGVVAARGGLMFTRAVEDGFAVIDLPGLAGVRGYLNNQEIGRTDAKGRLFIPNLLSYYDNRVEIADQDIPMDYDIQSTEQIAVPPYRGGAIVHFPVRRVRAVSGTVVVERASTRVVPSYGLLELEQGGTKLVADLGEQGEFYFDNLVPGDYQARVEYGDRSCAFILRVPESGEPVTSLGSVSCGSGQIGRVSL